MKRFFKILFSNWTYEISYFFEILRALLINAIMITMLILRGPVFHLPVWTYVPICVVFVFFWIVAKYSIDRFIMIYYNKKEAVIVTYNQLKNIINEYPGQLVSLKVNKKYLNIMSVKEIIFSPTDTITLILINKNSLHLKKELNDIIQKKDE